MNLFAIAIVALVATGAAGSNTTAVGFCSSGIMAGSAAAGIQSGIGNVSAGSLFANFPSIGTLGGWLGLAVAVATAAVGAIMTAVGFGSSGIMAGSAAAGIQSWIGNVSAGSFFANCQSIGMLGGWLRMLVGGAFAFFFIDSASQFLFLV
jgi:hypothetical protein